jgi:hypothetical protein
MLTLIEVGMPPVIVILATPSLQNIIPSNVSPFFVSCEIYSMKYLIPAIASSLMDIV